MAGYSHQKPTQRCRIGAVLSSRQRIIRFLRYYVRLRYSCAELGFFLGPLDFQSFAYGALQLNLHSGRSLAPSSPQSRLNATRLLPGVTGRTVDGVYTGKLPEEEALKVRGRARHNGERP